MKTFTGNNCTFIYYYDCTGYINFIDIVFMENIK